VSNPPEAQLMRRAQAERQAISARPSASAAVDAVRPRDGMPDLLSAQPIEMSKECQNHFGYQRRSSGYFKPQRHTGQATDATVPRIGAEHDRQW